MDAKTETTLNNIIIRPAQVGDTQAFRALRLEALQNHPEAFSSDFEMNVRHPPTYWEKRLRSLGKEDMLYFAAHDNNLIGMCGIYQGNSPKTWHNGNLWGVYVRPQWRGIKIAEALIQKCVEWGQKHGIKIYKLGVVATNLPAIRCYARCGFKVYGIEPQAIFYNDSMYDELLMAKTTGTD